MSKLLILLCFVTTNCFAFDYGKVRIKLSEQVSDHSLSIGFTNEQSNDLIDSQGLEVKYLKSISPLLRVGATYTGLNSAESSNGSRVKEQLKSNGVIQRLELKKRSLFIESQYRVARGVIKVLGKYQSLMFVDMGLGVGSSIYENSDNDNETSKTGWSYYLSLGAKISDGYTSSFQITKLQDGINDDLKNNQTYFGFRIGCLW